MLRLWMENPSPAEIDSVEAGDGEFTLTAKPPIIFAPSSCCELHAAIRDQAAAPFNIAEYSAACRKADDPSVHPQVVTTRLLHQARVRCRGGD
jgi:hypothetical protein